MTAVITHYVLNYAPLQIHMLKSNPLIPQNMTVFEERAFKELIRLQ